MLGSTARHRRLRGYSGSGPARLWRHARRSLPAVATIGALGLGAAACSFSYDLSTFAGKYGDRTGTAALPAAAAKPADKPAATDGLPPAADLVFARAAVHEVLSRGGTDASLPWENPESGARGTITPVTSAYSREGAVCRDFLASYVRKGNEAWLQGEACRVDRGKWEVKNLRPWKQI